MNPEKQRLYDEQARLAAAIGVAQADQEKLILGLYEGVLNLMSLRAQLQTNLAELAKLP